MNQRTTLEVIAPTVEEAIAQGLAELGLTADAVSVEVLDAGNKGLFGLGKPQVRVRLTVNPVGSVMDVQTESVTRSQPEPERVETNATRPPSGETAGSKFHSSLASVRRSGVESRGLVLRGAAALRRAALRAAGSGRV